MISTLIKELSSSNWTLWNSNTLTSWRSHALLSPPNYFNFSSKFKQQHDLSTFWKSKPLVHLNTVISTLVKHINLISTVLKVSIDFPNRSIHSSKSIKHLSHNVALMNRNSCLIKVSPDKTFFDFETVQTGLLMCCWPSRILFRSNIGYTPKKYDSLYWNIQIFVVHDIFYIYGRLENSN